MAQLRHAAAPIPARQQLAAIAWLRWRLFANSFTLRPRQRGVALLFPVLLRLLVYPFVALFFASPIAAGALIGYITAARGNVPLLTLALTGAFLSWQYVGVYAATVSSQTAAFHPASLLRFPIPFARYVLLRLVLGILTPSTVAGSLAMLAAAIGMAFARPTLLGPALLFLCLYALLNLLFMRMAAAWIERWLATRFARQLFTITFVLLFVGLQLVSLHVRSMTDPRTTLISSRWLPLVASLRALLDWLPPGLAARGIFFFSARPLATLLHAAGLLACCALFLAVFAARMRRQYLGEEWSEGAARRTAPPRARPQASPGHATELQWDLRPSQVFLACFQKEWVYLQANSRQWLGALTTLLLVFVFSSPQGVLGRHPAYALQGATAYVLFAPLAALFNTFGADAAGFQFYLLAPVRLREVLLAKNLVHLLFLALEIVLAWTLILARLHRQISAATEAGAALWTLYLLFLALGLGTLRSMQAPRRYVPGQSRQSAAPANASNMLLLLGVLGASFLLQIPVALLAEHLGRPWLPSAVFAPLAAGALLGYLLVLSRADRLLLRYRERLSEELGRLS
ncbi:MAG TPA: hypothetical protein VGD62_11445 [Acidobacteriaceae bacterium]